MGRLSKAAQQPDSEARSRPPQQFWVESCVTFKHTERMSSQNEEAMSPVNYDDEPIVELPLGELLYRLDPALGGSTLGLSLRGPGSWQWQYLAEVKWDGSTLRSKVVERPLLEQLGRALSAAAVQGA